MAGEEGNARTQGTHGTQGAHGTQEMVRMRMEYVWICKSYAVWMMDGWTDGSDLRVMEE